MSKFSEAPVLRLPMKDVPPASLRERHGALLRVASMSTDGGNGLARFMTEGLNKDTQPLFKEGANFLERILLDVKHHRFGVNVWSDEKITYYPHEIFKAFANLNYRDLDLPEDQLVDMVAEEMERLATELLPIFSGLANGESKDLEQNKLAEIFKRYRRLGIPYLNVSSLTHAEFMRQYSPPF